MKLAYYEDEVPKELVVNEVYTAREIYLYMIENKDVYILSDSVHLDNRGLTKYKIISREEKFIHKQAENSYRTHLIPNTRTKLVEISLA